jgi:hypothetical protein
MARTSEQIQADLDKEFEEMQKLRAKLQIISDRRDKLFEEKHCAQIRELGVGGEVIVRAQGWLNDKRLDHAIGKIVEIKRTRVVVEYDFGRFFISMQDLLPACKRDMQGFTLSV